MCHQYVVSIVYKSTSAFCCHAGNCSNLPQMSSSSPFQAHVLQLQLSDFHPHCTYHLDDLVFSVLGAVCTHFFLIVIPVWGIQHNARPHLTCKHTAYAVLIPADALSFKVGLRGSALGRRRNKQPIKCSNLVYHQTIDSLVTWWRECYFLLSDLMPSTFSPPVKYSSSLST